ncbi:radical SAM protein, partial [Streptomyces sp. NPDC002454]
MVVIAGDKVPSVHLHAVNAGIEEIAEVLEGAPGRRVLLGPMAAYVLVPPLADEYAGLFHAVHTHTVTAADLISGSRSPAAYDILRQERGEFAGLVEQMRWRPIAELELYRGCTRKRFCSFCNEPGKSPLVAFRTVEDVIEEAGRLYDAGVRNFRLGQQTCFFSYRNRDEAAVHALLAGIRERCPALEVLHIDNADPLSVEEFTAQAVAGA